MRDGAHSVRRMSRIGVMRIEGRQVPSASAKALPDSAPWSPGMRARLLLAVLAIAAAAAFQLRLQGRPWWCACGAPHPWAGDVWSPHNSQHPFDPYCFTHLLHGIVLCGLLAWIVPRVASAGRLVFALGIEAAWEIVENTEFVIHRFREATMSLQYHGDTVSNAMGDILLCGVGFALARRLGFTRSLAVFLLTELVLGLWIRDGLILSVLMLLRPSETIRSWQMG